MLSENLFCKVVEFKERITQFFCQKKKIKALENYSEVAHFEHKDYLILIKKCMRDDFLGDIEANFLSYMTNKYFSEQSHLDWTHKTKQLKKEMRRLARLNGKHVPEQMMLFDFDKSREVTSNVPLEILGNARKTPMRRGV